MPGTRKLGRKTAHRNLMLRGMVTFLLDNGKIETTLTRAKEVRSMTEKMITLGKKNTLASRRQALAYITKEDVVKKYLIKSHHLMRIATAVTRAFINSARAEVTVRKWH